MKGQEDIGAGVATETETEIETGIVIENVTVRGIEIAGESQMFIQGLGAEVGSQEGSLLVGTKAPSKHCIWRLCSPTRKRYHSWKALIITTFISTLYRSGTVP